MKHSLFAAATIAVLLFASCSNDTRISGSVRDLPSSEIVVARLGVGTFESTDTIKTSADGSFKYALDIKKGDPEFVYIYHNDKKIASLLLEKGEKVRLETDTLGNCSVSGSEGSEMLSAVDSCFTSYVRQLASTEDSKELSSIYVSHYRESVKYIMEHPFSLTVIPVLYETVNNLATFGQYTDALHFRSACDSLKTVYPESRYVKALDKEASRRENLLSLSASMESAQSIGFPDLNLTDITGNKISLSSVDAKAILVHFWSADDAAQKMMNLDVLQPVYDSYRSRGFEIYSVCISADKALWASVVKSQDLPWINVNDGLGSASPAIRLYNVSTVPTSYLIADGEIVSSAIKDAAGLRRQLDKLL